MIEPVKHTQCVYNSGKVKENNKQLWTNKREEVANADKKGSEGKDDQTANAKKDEVTESYLKLKSTGDLIRGFIEEQRETVKDRIEKGQDGPVIQIGSSKLTKKQWDKLLEKVDDELEAIKERIKQEIKEAEKKEAEEKLREKKRKIVFEEMMRVEKKLMQQIEKEEKECLGNGTI